MSFLSCTDKIVNDKVRDKMSEIVNDFVNKIVNINDEFTKVMMNEEEEDKYNVLILFYLWIQQWGVFFESMNDVKIDKGIYR